MEYIRVLIVDDLPQVRQELATVLPLATRRDRFTIKVIGEAQNGSEAIQQAKALHPDVILMDLEMPTLDGYAACHSIKLTAPSIGIIALTIHNDPESRRKANQAGLDEFIEKGAPLEELIQAIQRLRKIP